MRRADARTHLGVELRSVPLAGSIALAAALGSGCERADPQPAPSEPSISSSADLLRATFRALRRDDREAWAALSLASASDYAELCRDGGYQGRSQESVRRQHAEGFEACRAIGSWDRLEIGIRERRWSDGLNRDERRCGDVPGCPGLERLCKSELFAYERGGTSELKVSAESVVRRTRDGTVLAARPPRCVSKSR